MLFCIGVVMWPFKETKPKPRWIYASYPGDVAYYHNPRKEPPAWWCVVKGFVSYWANLKGINLCKFWYYKYDQYDICETQCGPTSWTVEGHLWLNDNQCIRHEVTMALRGLTHVSYSITKNNMFQEVRWLFWETALKEPDRFMIYHDTRLSDVLSKENCSRILAGLKPKFKLSQTTLNDHITFV